MTELAQKIKETPMAPYTDLLDALTREQKQIVVMYITESMAEQSTKSNEEIIREKYKNLKVSPELKRLRGCIKLTEEDLKDERTQYVLNR
jgi:dihydroxyacetone kinase-like predicted kinase